MLNPESKKLGIPSPDFRKMNQAQRQAVSHGEGPLLLLAGPGSGKTFTITNRILYLLNQGTSPGEILVITFTKDASLSMKKRFADMVAPEQYLVNFGTFHSVFYQILRESNVVKSNKLLSDSEKKNLLLPILYKYSQPGEEMSLLGEEAVKILTSFSFYKNTGNIEGAISKCPEQWRESFNRIYGEYQQNIIRENRLDFDDMLYRCKQILTEDERIRKYWQNRFQHILIDEFQDINPVQYEIVKLLARAPYNLFFVGDDDQAIYGFRGSSPECMRRFEEEFHAKQLILDVNYRSTSEIVSASLAVINENKNRFIKQLSAVRKEGEASITISAFQESNEQYVYLLQKLREKHSEQSGETYAVLFRTNQYMQGFAVRLQQAGIPYEMKEKQVSIYQNAIIQDVMAYLQLAKGLGNREQLLRIINKPSRYIKREAVLVKDGQPDFETMRECYNKPWIDEAERRKGMEHIECLEKHFESLKKLSIGSAITYILKVFGYEEYLHKQAGKSDKLEEWRRLLDWLKEDGKRFKNLREWVEFQEEYALSIKGETGKYACKQIMEKQIEEQSLSSIHLMTVHAAKGLEFDAVWIPDCNERVFPYGRMPDEKTVEEERRIFYVAMTRAKKSLELLYITGIRERPRQPSAFLNPLYSSSINSSNSQLSKYSSKASATASYSSSSAIYSNTGSSLGSSGFSL